MTTPIERLRQRHVAAGFPDNQCCVVLSCGLTWPCDTVAALDALEEGLHNLLDARPTRGQLMARIDTLQAENARLREQAEALVDALRNQGLLQNSPNGVIWHVHDCPASFDFAECNYRCRVAREAFALAGTEPYVSPETKKDTEVYE